MPSGRLAPTQPKAMASMIRSQKTHLYIGRKQALRTFEVSSQGTIDRKSTRLNSSHTVISYAVFCLKKKKMPHSTPFQHAIGTRSPPDRLRRHLYLPGADQSRPASAVHLRLGRHQPIQVPHVRVRGP